MHSVLCSVFPCCSALPPGVDSVYVEIFDEVRILSMFVFILSALIESVVSYHFTLFHIITFFNCHIYFPSLTVSPCTFPHIVYFIVIHHNPSVINAFYAQHAA